MPVPVQNPYLSQVNICPENNIDITCKSVHFSFIDNPRARSLPSSFLYLFYDHIADKVLFSYNSVVTTILLPSQGMAAPPAPASGAAIVGQSSCLLLKNMFDPEE